MHKPSDIRYIIAGPARSGTTITHLAIMGHPNACALNDEINVYPFFYKGFATFTSGAEKEKEKDEGLSILFNALTTVYRADKTIAHGMKTTVQSIDAANVFVEALKIKLKDVKIILTARNDIVAVCLLKVSTYYRKISFMDKN